jgi:hypothetical protein
MVMNRETQMTEKTAIQRIQELDRERTELFEQAKEEALRRAHQALEDLNALGLKYRLVEGELVAGRSVQELISRQIELMTRQARIIFENIQEFMKTCMQVISGGTAGAGGAKGTIERDGLGCLSLTGGGVEKSRYRGTGLQPQN